MIQGVISRVSGFSAAVKNFAVTVLVGLVVFAFEKEAVAPLRTAIVAIAAFLLMDGYYHLLEVRYRELHKAVANAPIEAGSSMLLEAPKPSWANVRKVISSKTLLPFYVLLLFSSWIALKESPYVHPVKTEANTAAISNSSITGGQASTAGERVEGRDRPRRIADERVDPVVQQNVDATQSNGAGDVR
jgi:hypothetical protein